MARVNRPTMLGKSFHLNKQEEADIESQIASYSPAYLIGKPERIIVRLTKKGQQSYKQRLYSRPVKIESLSTEDVYVFDCTYLEIYNYFFSFGADAEVISPPYMRTRFKNAYENALKQYFSEKQ